MNFVKLIRAAALASVGILGVLPGFHTSAEACPTARPAGDLVVALRNDAQPFTNFVDGDPVGFNVTLWERIVKELEQPDDNGVALDLDITYVECNNIGDQETALADGYVDVVISPLTITSQRMERYDFSQQYISSGLSVAVPARNAIDFEAATKIIRETIFSSTVAAAVIGFLTFNLVMAAMIRWILFSPEERHAGGRFGNWVRAMLEALMRTIGLRGIGGEYRSAISTMFEIFMAVVGTALSATILGVLTSAFVGSVGGQDTINATKLASMRIATIHCSTAQNLLVDQYDILAKGLAPDSPQSAGLDQQRALLNCPAGVENREIPDIPVIDGLKGHIKLVSSWSAAMAQLADGTVDAVLGDWVALTFLSRDSYDGQIDVLPNVYRNEPYGWGISRNVADLDIRRGDERVNIRLEIDRALIRNMRAPEWRADLEAALGAGAVSPNLTDLPPDISQPQATFKGDVQTRLSYQRYFTSGYYDQRYPTPNRSMWRRIKKHLSADSCVLDYGCGSGRYLFALQGHVARAVGFDVSAAALTLVRQRAATTAWDTLSVVGPDAGELDDHITSHGQVDLVLCLFGVLGHITDAQTRSNALKQMHGALQQGGRLLISVPNRARRFRKEQKAGAIDGLVRYSRDVDGAPMHLNYQLFDPERLSDELRQAGFHVRSLSAESVLPESWLLHSFTARWIDSLLTPFCPTRWGYGLVAEATL